MSLAQRNKSRSLWVRKESRPSLFHVRGWLTGLGVAGLIAAGVLVVSPVLIEPEVEGAAKVRLASLGFEVQKASAQGQDLEIWIGGGPGTKNQVLAGAQAIARSTDCALFGANLPCVEQVKVHLSDDFAARAKKGPRTQPAPVEREVKTAVHQPKHEPQRPSPSPALQKPLKEKPVAEPPSTEPPNTEPTGAHARCQAKLADLMLQQSIRFRTASTRIVKESYKLIETLARTATDCPGYIVVLGHTDNVGKAQANAWLSRVRAKAVRRALISRGLPEAKIFAQGKGAQEPIASNDTPSGRAKNRRIEFRVVPTAPSSQESTGQ